MMAKNKSKRCVDTVGYYNHQIKLERNIVLDRIKLIKKHLNSGTLDEVSTRRAAKTIAHNEEILKGLKFAEDPYVRVSKGRGLSADTYHDEPCQYCSKTLRYVKTKVCVECACNDSKERYKQKKLKKAGAQL